MPVNPSMSRETPVPAPIPALPPRLAAMFDRQGRYGVAPAMVIHELGGGLVGRPAYEALLAAGVVELVLAPWGKRGEKVVRLVAPRED
jgi:hypothetical protein